MSYHWLFKNMILKYVVLYGCEMWSLTLREERLTSEIKGAEEGTWAYDEGRNRRKEKIA